MGDFIIPPPGDVIALEPAIRRLTPTENAELMISSKWDELGGRPGAPTTPGEGGLISIADGFYRQYANGRIYYSRPHNPTKAFQVYGLIGDRYIELGGPTSWLGWPTSDELDFTEGGRVSQFEKGTIYFWPGAGAFELRNIVVRYSGLLCFGVEDGFPGIDTPDEPYVLLATVPAAPALPISTRSRIYEGVDAGEGVADNMELYRGLPLGFVIGTTVMEHDYGDPDKYLAQVQAIVDQIGNGVSAGCALVPYVGPILGPTCKLLWERWGPALAEALNELLGTDDEAIGSVAWTVSAKDMVTLARAPRQSHWGVDYHLQTELISGRGASYKVCIVIEAE